MYSWKRKSFRLSWGTEIEIEIGPSIKLWFRFLQQSFEGDVKVESDWNNFQLTFPLNGAMWRMKSIWKWTIQWHLKWSYSSCRSPRQLKFHSLNLHFFGWECEDRWIHFMVSNASCEFSRMQKFNSNFQQQQQQQKYLPNKSVNWEFLPNSTCY